MSTLLGPLFLTAGVAAVVLLFFLAPRGASDRGIYDRGVTNEAPRSDAMWWIAGALVLLATALAVAYFLLG